MKKANRTVFVLQLIVLTVLGTVIYFQNSYVSLFYKDITYIDVLASDDKAFMPLFGQYYLFSINFQCFIVFTMHF